MLGCGLPGGEQGFNLARVVAVLLGYDGLPGTTVTRYCSSSLQTTRMAYHAIKAGEGDVFISAGWSASAGSRRAAATAGPTRTTRVRGRGGPAGRRGRGRASLARPAEDAGIPDVYIAMGQPRRTWPSCAGSPGRPRTSSASGRRTGREGPRQRVLAADITPVTLPDGTVVSADDGPRPGTTLEKVPACSRCSARTGPSPRGTVAARRRRGRGRGDERRQGGRLGSPRWPDRVTGVTGLSPEIMGLGPWRPHAGPEARRDDDRRHRPGGDQRGVRRAGMPFTPSSASTRTS